MKLLRKLLFPFSGLYYIVTFLRNLGYDYKLIRAKSYPIPILGVGNLSTGGTGKTPMVEYLIRHFQDTYQVATLSRGYGRKSKGFILLKPDMNASEVGDEPLQFAKKFDNIEVAVSESRQKGIAQLLQLKPDTSLIIMDDAYQHRKVTAGLYIVLTPYHKLYCDDWVLPVGDLREPRLGAKRAAIVMVTKCPNVLSDTEREAIKGKLKLLPSQQLFFSSIEYDEQVYSTSGSMSIDALRNEVITLVTGIANPKPLVTFLNDQGIAFEHLKFKDHHHFALSEIKNLQHKPCILTTEKDYMRLNGVLDHNKMYYLPISFSIQEEARFKETLDSHIAQLL